MQKALDVIKNCGIIPVIVLEDPAKAVPMAHALAAGGIPCAEITFRTAEAAESIRRIVQEVPELCVGAGTVVSVELAEKAASAGAQFIVAPGFNPAVVDWCLQRDLTVIPGVNNPTGVESGMEKGLSLLKFFPASVSGGTGMLDALYGPYPSISFIPTGGITLQNLADYLKRRNVFAVGGSWMVSKDLTSRGEWTQITTLAKEAVSIVRSLREKD